LEIPAPLEPDLPRTSLSVSASNQTTYEYIQIQSARGPVVVPVETQVASRRADEKRKRNAGASARLRARQKEREKEASTKIDRLKEQLRMMKEACDYYRSENEHLMEEIRGMPNGERYVQRSPSPPAKRHSQSTLFVSTDGPTSLHPSLSQGARHVQGTGSARIPAAAQVCPAPLSLLRQNQGWVPPMDASR
jgi:hypothetical protein